MLPETVLTTCRKNVFAFFSLLLLILIPYSNTFDASWHFDDRNNIVKNTTLHLTEFNLENIKKTFFASPTIGDNRLYRPTACLSFALNYYFGKTRVFGYHLVNLMIHFLAAFFLYLFIHSTLNLPLLKEKYGQNSYFIALLGTVLWAINPVQTQAVTYIVQRMASMAGMFYIAAMYFYLKGRTSAQLSARILSYMGCIVSGVLAFGSKENAIMLPISILVFDLFVIQGVSKKNVKRFLWFLSIVVVVCALTALVLSGPSLFRFQNFTSMDPNRGFSPAERLLTEPRVILFYLSLLFYPMPNRLCLEHDIAVSTGFLTPPSTLIAIAVVLCMLILCLAGAKKWPLISFCIIFFFLNHLIEGSFILLELVFEHRNYIPSMLLFVPVSIMITRALGIFSQKKWMQFVLCAFMVAVLITFGHGTFIRNIIWKNDGLLYHDVVEKNPISPRAYHNLGSYYFKIGLKDTALGYFKKSLSLPERPNRKIHHSTLNNMGTYYKSKGDIERARHYFIQASKLHPGFLLPYLGLGILSINEGKNSEGISYLDKVLKYKSNVLIALKYKGLALLRENNIDKAIAVFGRALDINPADVYALTHLGIAYKAKGQLGKALSFFKQALSINGKNLRANLYTIELYQLTDQTEKAEETAMKLLHLFPDDKLFNIMDKVLLQNENPLTSPDSSIIAPIFEKILIQKAQLYRTYVLKFNNRTKQEASQNK